MAPTEPWRSISSPTNSLLKVFRRALREGTTRDGWVALEGPFLVEEAILAAECGAEPHVAIQSVLVAESAAAKLAALLSRLPARAEITAAPERLFREIAQTETPQGIAALVELQPPDLGAILAGASPLLAVACGIQDPGNLGAIVRSAQALGGAALVTVPGTVSPFNPKAIRASAGAILRLPVFPGVPVDTLFDQLRSAGVRAIAADRSAIPVSKADLCGGVAYLVGAEGAGLAAELRDRADASVGIPIGARTDSLNAAAAAAILLYEAARQRGFSYARAGPHDRRPTQRFLAGDQRHEPV